MSTVPETPAMRRARAHVAVNTRHGHTEEADRWRKTYARLEAAELRRRADELERQHGTG